MSKPPKPLGLPGAPIYVRGNQDNATHYFSNIPQRALEAERFGRFFGSAPPDSINEEVLPSQLEKIEEDPIGEESSPAQLLEPTTEVIDQQAIEEPIEPPVLSLEPAGNQAMEQPLVIPTTEQESQIELPAEQKKEGVEPTLIAVQQAVSHIPTPNSPIPSSLPEITPEADPPIPEKIANRSAIETEPRKWEGSTILGTLVRLYKLDVYGLEYLTRRARYTMEMASVILSVIFLFDFFLWFVLLNLIFHKGEAGAGGLLLITELSVIPAFLALCFALVSTIFEANIFTADLSEVRLKTMLSLSGRVILIIVAALITAEPLHIMIFDGPIAERWRQELAIQKGVQIAAQKQVENTEIRQRAGTKNRLQNEERLLVEQQEKLGSKERSLFSLNKEIITKRKVCPKSIEYRSYGTRYKRRIPDDPIKKAELEEQLTTQFSGVWTVEEWNSVVGRRVRSCNSEIRQLEKQRDDIEFEIGQANKSLGSISQDLDDTKEKSEQCMNLRDATEEWYNKGIENYARKLNSTESNSAFTMDGCLAKKSQELVDGIQETQLCSELNASVEAYFKGQIERTEDTCQIEELKRKRNLCSAWCFEYTAPDFWERLIVLDDIIHGKPPRWPANREFSESECQEMIGNLKFERPRTGRCATYAVKSTGLRDIQQEGTQELLHTVVIESSAGNQVSIGDSLQCRPFYLDENLPSIQSQIAWEVNGVQKGSKTAPLRFNDSENNMRSSFDSCGLKNGDTISCRVFPSYVVEGKVVAGKSMLSDNVQLKGQNLAANCQSIASTEEILLNDDSKKLWWMYWLVTCIGIFVPMVSLLFKMVSPRATIDYYSLRWQAAAGHGEALRQIEAQERSVDWRELGR